jgi:hypothetical protein
VGGSTCTTDTNAIPSVWLKVRIKVTTISSSVPVYVKVRELTGWSWPTDPTKWNCERVHGPFTAPQATYNIGPNGDVCSGSSQILNLSCVGPACGTPLPAGATITWYQSQSCPSVNPWNPALWNTVPPPPQNGGTSFNTNYLTNTTCYVAVIQDGCWRYISNVRKLTVCLGKPNATIAASPIAPSPTLVNIANEWHACTSWSGTLTLTPSPYPFPCKTIISWSLAIDNGAYNALSPADLSHVATGTLTTGTCSRRYRFRATLYNACGTTQVVFPIVIDKAPDGGSIQTVTNQPYDVGTGTQQAPLLCYNTGTRLRHTTTCGQIKSWEYKDETTPCSGNFPTAWLPVPGSSGTSTWWTGFLVKTRQYRAVVGNGACSDAYSAPITVTVKPELTVTIATPSYLLCDNPILTATTSYGAPCNYTTATYKWYLNGTPISGATGATYTPGRAGNYSVVVDDKACGKAESNVITICKPALVVTGPCCMCPPSESVTINAVVSDTCGVTPTYLWAGPGNAAGATTASINVTSAGTYSVTVTVGGCTLTRQITVNSCP